MQLQPKPYTAELTWYKTMHFRILVLAVNDARAPEKLQQGEQCVETGATRWVDVPKEYVKMDDFSPNWREQAQ